MKLKYVLSTITYDSVKSQTIECIEQAKWDLARDGIVFYWNTPHGDGKARSRSIAVSRFLKETPEAEYLVFIDSDILFTPQNLRQLFKDMEDGYDLIGGLFSVRGGTQASSYGFDGKIILDGKIHEFEYIATGFMGITRKLLEKIRDETPLPLLHPHDIKFYPFFEERQFPEREGEGIFLSEDYDFCEKARHVGVKPYIDTSIQLGHLGEKVFSLSDMIKFQAESKDKEITENQVRLRNLISDVAEFTDQAVERVHTRLENTRANMAKMWREYKGETPAFYTNNEECLYDDVNFNLSHDYARKKLSPLVSVGGGKVLDIGCGVGTLAIMLIEQHNEVTGYDVNKYTIGFCNWKKEKYNYPITFTTEMPDLKQFDLITCVDMLEHVEDLKGFIKMLGEMKSGARLYHNDAFEPQHHHPQHFDHSAAIDSYLKESGFKKVDELWAVKV